MSLMCNFTSLKTIADSAGLHVQAFCLREKKGEARENRAKLFCFITSNPLQNSLIISRPALK